MTYNIHHGRGLDGRVDIPRIAGVIMDARPDLVALQEVDCGVGRSGGIDTMEVLSELTGMSSAFGKNLDYDGGEYGNGILSRLPIVKTGNLHYRMIHAEEQRGLLHAVVEANDTKLVFMSTHIDYRPDDTERLMNVDEIVATAEAYAALPVVVCGDFNAVPESRTIERMARRFLDVWLSASGHQPPATSHESKDVPNSLFNPQSAIRNPQSEGTFPAVNAAKRIDYIFLSKPHQDAQTPRLEAVSAWVVHSDASDHLPVVAELQLVS